MEWLQKIIAGAEIKDGALDVESLVGAIKKEIPRHFVTKEVFNAKEKELGAPKHTIKHLNKNNADNADLQTRISEHETTIVNLQKENADLKKTYALKTALSKEGCKDPDYLIYKQGGLEKFTFDKDGNPIGVKELVEPMKADNPLLFPTGGKESHYTPQGGGGAVKNPFLADSFNLTEQGKMLRENPEQARAMAAAAGVEL